MSITIDERRDLHEIYRLLDEAYRHYFEHSDGYCKLDEGLVEITFNNYFDREGGAPFRIKAVNIFSYVLGPSRMHTFTSTSQALAAVQQWHAQEMLRKDHEERCIPVEKLSTMTAGDSE